MVRAHELPLCGKDQRRSSVHKAIEELANLVLKWLERMDLAQAKILQLVAWVRGVHAHVAADTLVPRLLVDAASLQNGTDAMSALHGFVAGVLERCSEGLASDVGLVVDEVAVVATKLFLIEAKQGQILRDRT